MSTWCGSHVGAVGDAPCQGWPWVGAALVRVSHLLTNLPGQHVGKPYYSPAWTFPEFASVGRGIPGGMLELLLGSKCFICFKYVVRKKERSSLFVFFLFI